MGSTSGHSGLPVSAQLVLSWVLEDGLVRVRAVAPLDGDYLPA